MKIVWRRRGEIIRTVLRCVWEWCTMIHMHMWAVLEVECCLWPPCVADADIIFSSGGFFFFCLLFFPRLISTVTDWMSTILPHMVWPSCKFRMHVWNVLHAARWKYWTQKIAKNSASRYHHTTLSCYIFATKAPIDNWEKVVKQQYLPHMSLQYGQLPPISGCNRFVSLGHPS